MTLEVNLDRERCIFTYSCKMFEKIEIFDDRRKQIHIEICGIFLNCYLIESMNNAHEYFLQKVFGSRHRFYSVLRNSARNFLITVSDNDNTISVLFSE